MDDCPAHPLDRESGFLADGVDRFLEDVFGRAIQMVTQFGPENFLKLIFADLRVFGIRFRTDHRRFFLDFGNVVPYDSVD